MSHRIKLLYISTIVIVLAVTGYVLASSSDDSANTEAGNQPNSAAPDKVSSNTGQSGAGQLYCNGVVSGDLPEGWRETPEESPAYEVDGVTIRSLCKLVHGDDRVSLSIVEDDPKNTDVRYDKRLTKPENEEWTIVRDERVATAGGTEVRLAEIRFDGFHHADANDVEGIAVFPRSGDIVTLNFGYSSQISPGFGDLVVELIGSIGVVE